MTVTRDRDGELVDQVAVVEPWHDPRCRAGWLPETVDRRPVPCLVCRPHVARAQDDVRRRAQRPHRVASAEAQAAAMATIRRELARARLQRTRSAR